MSMGTPTKKEETQKEFSRIPAAKDEFETTEPAAPQEPRKAFDIVIFIVVIALVAIYVIGLINPATPVTHPVSMLSIGNKTIKPGKTVLSSSTTPIPVSNQPVITEIMAGNNGSITSEDGKYYDWIEIYNPTGHAMNLGGFALSSKPKKPTEFVLPNYTLGPGKFMIVFASKLHSTATEIHANFKLSSSGQTLTMSDPNGHQIQSIAYPPMQKDCSWAMDMNDNTKWSSTDKCTPGYPNTGGGYTAYQQTRHATAALTINEIMAGNLTTIKDKDGNYSDWVELYNPTDQAVDITGWGLSNKESEPKRWVFPQMKIEPKQYIVVFASGKDQAVAGQELHTNFRLNAFKDTVILANLRGQIVSEILINRLKPDTSWGLVPGTDKWQDFTHSTPGYPNNDVGWNALQHK